MLEVSVEGQKRLEKAVAGKNAEVRAALEKVVGESAQAIYDDWRDQAAYDKGDYRDAIGVHHEGLDAEVGVFGDEASRYAMFPEFGTSKQPAQPAAQPAAEKERGRFERRIRDAIE